MAVLSDASDVDAAICAYLANDSELAGLLPDGVFYDVAAPNSRQFAIVAMIDHGADPILEQRTAWETYLYLVKAVVLGEANNTGPSGATAKAAAARIHDLMQNAALIVPGYLTMKCQRIERIRYTEIDEASDARWQHRGGHYELWMIPED